MTGHPPALAPCPFCGGAAQVEREGSPRVSCIVACEDCGARLESNENGSGYHWNRRAASGVEEAARRVVAKTRTTEGDSSHCCSWCGDTYGECATDCEMNNLRAALAQRGSRWCPRCGYEWDGAVCTKCNHVKPAAERCATCGEPREAIVHDTDVMILTGHTYVPLADGGSSGE